MTSKEELITANLRLAPYCVRRFLSRYRIPAVLGLDTEDLVSEAFLIENGKIRRVEMVGTSAAYHANSPWPGGLSGN